MNRRIRDYKSRHERRNTQNNADNKASNRRDTLASTRLNGEILAQINAGWQHHRNAFQESLTRLVAEPWQSLSICAAIGMALVLPMLLYMGLYHTQLLGQQWQQEAQVSVYLHPEAKPAAIEHLHTRLKQNTLLQNVTLITPEQAWQTLARYADLGESLNTLENNPLPAVLVLQLPPETIASPPLEGLLSSLEKEAVVSDITWDHDWLKRLDLITHLAQRIILGLGLLLALGALLIVGNTIRLAIDQRSDEITIIKMVGGTCRFIQRPFLYMGLFYGIGSGLFAMLVLQLAEMWLTHSVQQLLLSYQSQHHFYLLDANNTLLLFASAGALGWFGAWLAVFRHIQATDF